MKIRWTNRSLRVRLDDLELQALQSGTTLHARLHFPGGDWALDLGVGQEAAFGMRDGVLVLVLDARELALLADDDREGIERPGTPRVLVEKDFLPEHGQGA